MSSKISILEDLEQIFGVRNFEPQIAEVENETLDQKNEDENSNPQEN